MVVAKKAAPKKAAPKQEVKTVTCMATGGVNVREKASKGANIVDVIPGGHTVDVISTARGWHKIANGYVMAKFFE